MNHSPEAALILDLVEAFRRSKTMFTAVKLGIFDQLADGPKTLPVLTEKLAVNETALLRLLSGCVALGLLHNETGTYFNTLLPLSCSTSASPDTLAGYIRYSDKSLYPLWGSLEEAVRSGSNRWEEVFGSRTALFDHYFRDDDSAASFIGGMHGFGQLASERIAKAFDLSRFHQLVDLGGATGHLCVAVCQAWPHLKATVLDLPVVENSLSATSKPAPLQTESIFTLPIFSPIRFPQPTSTRWVVFFTTGPMKKSPASLIRSSRVFLPPEVC